MLNVGRFNKRIWLLKQTEVVGETFGETKPEWVRWRRLDATVHHISSREKVDNRHIEDEAEYRITVWYDPYGYLIDADMRIECKIRGKKRILYIIGDPVEKEDEEYLEILAKEYRVTEEDDLYEQQNDNPISW